MAASSSEAKAHAPRGEKSGDVEHGIQVQAGHDGLATMQSHATDASVLSQQQSVQAAPSRPWYKKMNPLRWGGVGQVPKERQVSREYKAGFLSSLTFEWMTPLMKTGYKRPLQQKDIWTVNPDRAVEPLTDKVKASFNRRVKSGQSHPLLRALHESFLAEFWLGGLCALLGTLPQVLAPFTLRYLINFATEAYEAREKGQPAPPIGRGIGLAVGITAMQVVQSICISHFIYRGMMLGGQSRGVLIGMIYEKSLVISPRAKAGDADRVLLTGTTEKQKSEPEPKSKRAKGKKAKGKRAEEEKSEPGREKGQGQNEANGQDVGAGWSNGRVVNVMSVDTYRIDQASALFHMIWTAPVSCIITLVLLLVNLTYSALAGFGLLVIGIPVLTRAIQSLLRRRKAINKLTDQRVSLTQEILQSVRFVKYFGWEQAFVDRLAAIRAKEIYAIQILLSIRNAINAVSMSMPVFASMLSFITYSLTSHGLGAASVFSSLALFNSLRIPLNLVPLVLGQVTDAWSSLKRIEQYLVEEEQEEQFVVKSEGEHAIELHDASFTWEETADQHGSRGQDVATDSKKTPEKPSYDDFEGSGVSEKRAPFGLQDIKLEVGRNELIAVIGTVGSGKSSLLSALAGDMRKTSGEVVFGASRAFCPQYAWIQNTSLQNNITFGKDMNREWYSKVIEACALKADLDMLPNGDQTEIGERGITISGGQKQRLNIARAIYFDADIVLMDDPLSAVDAHVGRHIFDEAILGLLGSKCRILATHQLWVLSRCDRIVWMDKGRIQAVDSFDNLMRHHSSFRALMETTATEQEKKKKQEDEQDGEEGTDDVDPAEERRKRTKNKKGALLMQQEEQAQASVPWSVYGAYVRASGSMFNALVVAVLLMLSQGANIMTSLWLSYWTSHKYRLSTGQYIGIYAGLGALQALLTFAFSLLLSILGTRASRVMLSDAVRRVLRAPMSFFDTTPLGRITNRFSRDVDVMDNNLTDAMRMYFFTLAMVTAVFALIIAYFHWFAVALVPLYLFFMLAAGYYRASAREVKRFESVLRSHVFARFSEGLSGVASIRAYSLQTRFISQLRASIDDMNSAYYLTFANQRWLSLRLDMVGAGLVLTVGILVVTSRFDVSPSIAGLVLSYILSIVQLLQFSVRQLAEVENGMNAVERLRYYGTQLAEEAPLHTVAVRDTWPERGEIVFDAVEMRYRHSLPLVLCGLSMHIGGGERIGIVGRTGAGKSSIVSTLFRLAELTAGSITIDGLDIATLGLHDLRSRLAIIPQDPTLFRGTVRSNLDPFGQHTDLALWSALRQAHLVPADPSSSSSPVPPPSSSASDEDTPPPPKHDAPAAASPARIHLDSPVQEDGLNFSLGQRQLMALARALIRDARIIVCDEATSSVDMDTDADIQRTMASAFRHCTLICIAHRLRTIIGYDRICVMDAGRIAELDDPLVLWHSGSIFRQMCLRSGIGLADIQHARAPAQQPA